MTSTLSGSQLSLVTDFQKVRASHPRREPIWGHAIFFTYSLKRAEYVKAFVWLPYPFRKRKFAYVPVCWLANKNKYIIPTYSFTYLARFTITATSLQKPIVLQNTLFERSQPSFHYKNFTVASLASIYCYYNFYWTGMWWWRGAENCGDLEGDQIVVRSPPSI